MSTTIASRTTRMTPPPAPTRHRAIPRRTLTPGGSAIGLADRPVLRIVADDERAPVFTRIRPVPSEPVVEHDAGDVGVETAARVDLDEFFAAEYDGDDQRLEVVRRRPSSVRLTRRGRMVVLGLGVAAALGLGFVLASGSMASDHGEQTRVITVQPGQTLWDISAQAAHGGDVRSMMSHLESLNHLGSTVLQTGQHLRVPQ
jgi:hypothetical protein